MSFQQMIPILPALIVSIAALAALLAQAFGRKGERTASAPIALAGLAAALAASVWIARSPWRGATLGAVTIDAFALFFHILLLSIGIVCVLLSPKYLRNTREDRGEYYALMLFSMVGMLGLSSCRELLSLFVALEIMSVALYAMAGMRRDRPESQESALKYFITGAFSSAFFLYGVALLYGATRSTSLEAIRGALGQAEAGGSLLPVMGAGFLLVGFGFKIASVPFHMWAPDVYEGAPTPVTALMSAGVKAAAFAAFLRVFLQGLPALASHWMPMIALLAFVTMLIGNLGALAQSNLKRMLAYSSIGHAGYLMTAMVGSRNAAAEAVLFYLVAYAAVNLGAFGALAALSRADGSEPLSLDDVSGLSERRPAVAAALTVYLVSLTGIPVSGGFVGKFQLFSAAVSGGYVWLAVTGMVMSVVSAYYYLRVVVAMYMRDPVAGKEPLAPVGMGEGFALAFTALLVLAMGVYPAPILALARNAASALSL
jgi:NADH-quinone oxidoreductase subunit N